MGRLRNAEGPADAGTWTGAERPTDDEWALARAGARRLASAAPAAWSPRTLQLHRDPASLWALALALVVNA